MVVPEFLKQFQKKDRPRAFLGEKPVWVQGRIWIALDGSKWEAALSITRKLWVSLDYRDTEETTRCQPSR